MYLFSGVTKTQLNPTAATTRGLLKQRGYLGKGRWTRLSPPLLRDAERSTGFK